MDVIVPEKEWKAMAGNADQMLAWWEKVFSDTVSNGFPESIMSSFTSDQLTLLVYILLRKEMLEGGMLQLLYNGYGPFVFENPFAKAMRLWGLKDFSKFVYSMRKKYELWHEELESLDVSDEEFMSLYERYPDLESLDDDFVDMEPLVSAEIINFVTGSPQQFGVTIKKEL